MKVVHHLVFRSSVNFHDDSHERAINLVVVGNVKILPIPGENALLWGLVAKQKSHNDRNDIATTRNGKISRRGNSCAVMAVRPETV